MYQYFSEQKEKISAFLKDFLAEKAAEFKRVNSWGENTILKLRDFILQGKMLRGGMTALGYEMHGGKHLDSVVSAAAAMELFQSAFLIHDDIMDRDLKRRGLPTIYYQYKEDADKEKLPDTLHFGESLGICAGDISFFLGFELLGRYKDEESLILPFCAKEVSYVCLAQMQDIYFGYSSKVPSENEIIDLYLYKTGRYSFSVPLMAGAMLAGKKEKELIEISRIGELMGIIFQIRDDELGIFGSQEELGKDIGSDIKENKKTLFYRNLMVMASPEEKQKVEKIYSGKSISLEDLEVIRGLIESLGIRKKISDSTQKLAAETRSSIEELIGIQEEYRQILLKFLDYNLARKK